MTEPIQPAAGDRYDFGALEFDSVRDLLMRQLTTPLGRHGVRDLGPCADADEAQRQLRQIAELVELVRGDVPAPLGGIVEVRTWLLPFFAGEHSPTTLDIADLKRLLRAVSRCAAWIRSDPGNDELLEFSESFPDVRDLAEELDRIVDERGEVLSTASEKLRQIRDEVAAAETAVRAAVQRFLGDPRVHRYLQNPEPSWRHGRPVFAVRREYRESVPGVSHDRSQSGATVFVEPAGVVEAANRLSDARAAEHREIQVILAHVCRGLARCRAEIESAVAVLTRLDTMLARARLVTECGFTVPTVQADGPVALRGGRHPILLDQPGDVVPLEVRLGDPHHLLVVTGPNTGGKTVVLKTIGLLSLMACCAIPVPAEEGSQFPFFDGIFADIGDEQAITQNLSTFSSHVRRIARCLNRSSGRSLVLLDELGAGTDPEEGGALGYAVLELLEKERIHAVVTTHLGQLKEFAYQHAGAENGSMAFDGSTLRPLYRLDVGVPGQSHALDIAGQVGMPEAVVARARERVGVRDMSMEQAVAQVQDTRRRAEQDRQRAERLRGAIEREHEASEEVRKQLERRRLWLHEEADALVEEQLRGARDELDRAVAEISQAPNPYGEKAAALRETVARLLKQTSVHRRRMKFLGDVRRDGVVYVPRLERRCVVKKIDRTRETCTVEVGKLRMEIPFEDVSWLQPLDGRG